MVKETDYMCGYVNVDAKWIDRKKQQCEGNNKKWKISGFDKSCFQK